MSIRLFVLVLAFFLPGSGASAQQWTMLNATGEMETREEGAFMSCKGKFYLMGGYGLKCVNIFDPGTRTWTDGSAPPVEMHHFQAVRLGTEIYVAGALTGIGVGERPLEHIYIYDTEKDQWRKGDPIPADRLRGSAGVAVYRGNLYLVGGTRSQQSPASTPWVDSYDPKTGKWKELDDLPHRRDHFHACVINGKIYAAGGRQDAGDDYFTRDQIVPQVDVYDINSGRWETQEQNLPTPRASCTSVAILDHLLVIGGAHPDQNAAYDLVEAYDVERGEWEDWGTLSEGRCGAQAFMCVGAVYVASGRSAIKDGQELVSIERLDL